MSNAKNHTPYCFNSNEEANAAANAVNAKFTEFKELHGEICTTQCKEAYCTERVLFVPTHDSIIFRFNIEDFIRKLGGKPCTDKN
jgi:hypothetical protein